MSSLSMPISNRSLVWSRGSRGAGQIRIQFPMELHWCYEQPCTQFKSLQHRKERAGLRHEFIVLEFTNGSICRIERMGDPDAPLYALSAEGSTAHDVAQCFHQEHIKDAHLDNSDIVSHIFLPSTSDLIVVIYICRAIHEAERTHNYTLRGFNCYFFAWTLQSCLTRIFAGWNDLPVLTSWRSRLGELSPGSISEGFQLRASTRTLALLHLVSRTHEWHTDRLFQEHGERFEHWLLDHKLETQIKEATCSELWHTELVSVLVSFLERAAEEIVVFGLFAWVKDFVSNCHDKGPKSRGMVILAWLGVLIKDLGLRQGVVTIGDRPMLQSEQVDTHPNSPGMDQMGYRRPGSLPSPYIRPQSERLTMSQWWMIAREGVNLHNLPFRLILTIHDILIGFGIVLITKDSPELCVVVEKELEEIASSHSLEEPSSTNKLDARIQGLFNKHKDGTAVWNNTPWHHVFEALKTMLPCNLFPPNNAVNPISGKKWYLRKDDMSIPSFQNHILAFIESHSKLVELAWLGSAAEIQTELKQKMAEIWRLIRENNDIDLDILLQPTVLFVLVIAVDETTHDLEILRRISGAPKLGRIDFSGLCGEVSLDKIYTTIKRLYDESAKVSGSELLILFTGKSDSTNRMRLNENESIDETDLYRYFERLKRQNTRPTVIPITILFDICRQGEKSSREPPEGIALIWSCSPEEYAHAFRLPHYPKIPHSCFLLALVMGSCITDFPCTGKTFKHRVEEQLDLLIVYLKEVYRLRHSKGRCPMCPGSDKFCKEPQQSIDWKSANNMRGILMLAQVLDTEIAQEIHRSITSNSTFRRANRLPSVGQAYQGSKPELLSATASTTAIRSGLGNIPRDGTNGHM